MDPRDILPMSRPAGPNARLNPGLRRINYRLEVGTGPVPVEEVEKTLPLPSPEETKSDTSDEVPAPRLPELNQDDIQAFYQQSLERSTANRSNTPSNRGMCFDDSSSEDGDMGLDGRKTRNAVLDVENAMFGKTPRNSPETSQKMVDAALMDYGSRTASNDLPMVNRSSDLTVTAINLSGSDTSKKSGQELPGSKEATTESSQETSTSREVTKEPCQGVLGSGPKADAASLRSTLGSTAPSSPAVSRTELTISDSASNIPEAQENCEASTTVVRIGLRKRIRRMLSRLARPFRACFRPKTQE